MLLNAFFNTHQVTKNRKKNYAKSCAKSYDSEKVKYIEKKGRDYKQFEIIDNGCQVPKSTKKEETKTIKTWWNTKTSMD